MIANALFSLPLSACERQTCGAGAKPGTGDFDNDGRPDIFVVSKTESCRLFRNLGDFKFEDVTDKAGVGDKGDAAKIWKFGATFADVNNDGLLDIYVCRYNAPNLLYINQGDGTFKEMAHAYGLDVVDSSVMAAFSDGTAVGQAAHEHPEQVALVTFIGRIWASRMVAAGLTARTESMIVP